MTIYVISGAGGSGSSDALGIVAAEPTGDGDTDTAALLDAVALTITEFGPDGGPVWLRASQTPYTLSPGGQISLPKSGGVRGGGTGGRSFFADGFVSLIDASALTGDTDSAAFHFGSNGGGQYVEDVTFLGPLAHLGELASRFLGVRAIDFGANSIGGRVSRCYIRGFVNGIAVQYASNFIIENTLIQNCITHGITVYGSNGAIMNSSGANCGAGAGTIEADHRPANIYIETSHNVIVFLNVLDEGINGIRIAGACEDVQIRVPTLFAGNLVDIVGLRIGEGEGVCKRTVYSGGHLSPWNPLGNPSLSRGLVIASNAEDTLIENTIIDGFTAGRAIQDDGVRTIYDNVNGHSSQRAKDGEPIAADFAGLPAGVAVQGILNKPQNRMHYLMPDGTVHYVELNEPDPPAPPVNLIAPAISGLPHTNATLTSTNGAWTQSPTSYTRQWKRGGVAISGATAQTYVRQVADEGEELTCTVTAVNASGSTPADSNALNLTLTPLWWTRPTEIAGLTDGAAISTQEDASAANRDFTATSTARPLKQTAGGVAVARFDGADDQLQHTAGASFLTGNTAMFFIVARLMAVNDFECLLAGSNAGVDDAELIIGLLSSGAGTMDSYHDGVGSSAHALPALNTPFLYAVTYDGTNVNSHLNGTAGTPVAVSSTFTIDRIRLGKRFAAQAANMDLIESLAYPFVTGFAEVQAELMSIYGIS